MNELPEDRRLFREAADLAIRLQGDPDNRVSVDTVRAWIARSPAHQQAWTRVCEIHGMTGQILTERYEPGEPGLGRRTFLTQRFEALRHARLKLPCNQATGREEDSGEAAQQPDAKGHQLPELNLHVHRLPCFFS